MTKDTYGLPSAGSSTSAALQSSLASRLRRSLAVTGSPEYALTWKQWDMASGPPICALRASGRRTSGSDCFGLVKGWTTPQAHDSSPRGKGQKAKHGTKHGCADLNAYAMAAGWTTPNAMPPNRGGLQTNPVKALERRKQGHMLNLDDAACLAGWATPAAREPGGTPEQFLERKKKHPCGQSVTALSMQAQLAGWVTPSSRDWKDTPGMSQTGTNPDGSTRTRIDQLPRQAAIAGQTPSGSPAPTEKRGALSPALSRWLMGYPAEWDSCGATAMQSCRSSRRRL